MSGTEALSKLDTYLNEQYNYAIEDEDDYKAEIIDDIRIELDKIYDEYFMKGD